jgi:hypothetical protein
VTSFLRSAFHRLPPVAHRDERIAALRRRVAKLENSGRAMTENPSFQVRISEEIRLRGLEIEYGAPSRSLIAGGKFHVYDFVRSHGIDVPEQLGQWARPDDIPWDDLPDQVVIKAAFGSTSRGVLPVRRFEGGWRVVTQETTVTGEQIAADLRGLLADGRIRGPFMAEEFLDKDGTGTPPLDAKIFAFYGDVQAVEMRRSDDHGNTSGTRHRILDVHGQDLVDAFAGRSTDPNIPVPDALDELVDVAGRLSKALRVPFTRVDLYEVSGRVVFGELTPRPGNVWFGAKVDAVLGDAWERAQVRIWRDIADGMSPEPEWGSSGQE